MSFVSSLFRDNSPQQADIQKPSTVAQANQLYGQVQGGIDQQQSFVNAVNAQNGLSNQNSVYQQLAGIANGTGPTVALNQLNQATGQNVANQAALAAGVRGSSQNAGLIARQAALSGANVQQQAAGQAATLRAQEQQGAISQMGGIATNQVNQQQGAINNLNNTVQGAQGQTLNSINGQNASAVSSQNSMNAANTAVTQAQFGMLGQGLAGAGAGMVHKAAHGGMIPSDSPSHGRLLEAWNRAHGLKADPKMADGGEVPGKAMLPGDNLKNDVVSTELSPGEVVIPRSILAGKDPGEAAKAFVEKVLAGKGPKPAAVQTKQALSAGGQVDDQPVTDADSLQTMQAQAPQDWFSKAERGVAELARPFVAPIMYGSGDAADKAYDTDVLKNQIANSTTPQEVSPPSNLASPSPLMKSPDAPTAPSPIQSEPPPSSPQDPFGYGAMTNSMMGGVASMRAGIMDQSKADSSLAQAQSKIADSQQQQIMDMHARFEGERDKLNTERSELMDQYKTGKIDPGHYFSSMNGGEHVSTAIGLILGGLGAGMAGMKSNPALDFMNKQIDRDIDSQKSNLNKTDSLLKQNLAQFGNLRDAEAATRLTLTDAMTAKLMKAAADSGSQAAVARAEEAVGKLQMDTAPIVQQMAMRKALLGGLQAGQIPAEHVIRAIVPEAQQQPAFKELGEAQQMVKARDNFLASFDQASKLNTVGSNITNPLQTGRRVDALIEPSALALSKASAGRVTPQDVEGIMKMAKPLATDNAATIALKRRKLDSFIQSSMQFPLLKGYGIDPTQSGRFNPQGQSKIQETKIGGS